MPVMLPTDSSSWSYDVNNKSNPTSECGCEDERTMNHLMAFPPSCLLILGAWARKAVGLTRIALLRSDC